MGEVRTEERTGLLFVLVGPGGVGKNTLMNRVLARVESLRQLPTATTRPIRPTEQQGREHHFMDEAAFRAMIARGDLLEYQEVTPGRFYGVPRYTVENAIGDGQDQIADIDYLGARILRHEYPENTVLVFIAPPSMAALEAQMRERGTPENVIRERMARAEEEMAFAPECDYLIINDNLDAAADDLHTLVTLRQAMRDVDPVLDRLTTYRDEVSYRVRVLPTVGDDDSTEALVRDDGQPLEEHVNQPGMPVHVARSLLQNVAGLEVEASAVALAAPPAIPAVEVAYEALTGAYTLTFTYSCPVAERMEPPGFVWRPLLEVASMTVSEPMETSES